MEYRVGHPDPSRKATLTVAVARKDWAVPASTSAALQQLNPWRVAFKPGGFRSSRPLIATRHPWGPTGELRGSTAAGSQRNVYPALRAGLPSPPKGTERSETVPMSGKPTPATASAPLGGSGSSGGGSIVHWVKGNLAWLVYQGIGLVVGLPLMLKLLVQLITKWVLGAGQEGQPVRAAACVAVTCAKLCGSCWKSLQWCAAVAWHAAFWRSCQLAADISHQQGVWLISDICRVPSEFTVPCPPRPCLPCPLPALALPAAPAGRCTARTATRPSTQTPCPA